jgi:hypothetical protein
MPFPLTFQDIQDYLIDLRFHERHRGKTKRWINLRLGEIWNAQDWDFKLTRPIELTLVINKYDQSLSSLTEPDDSSGVSLEVRTVRQVSDQNANELSEELTTGQFFREYPDFTTPAGARIGVPSVWAFQQFFDRGDGTRGERLLLGPAPKTAEVFNIVVERAFSALVEDGDFPRFPPELHDYLSLECLIFGMKAIGDDGWISMADEAERGYAAMQAGYVTVTGDVMFPRDPL